MKKLNKIEQYEVDLLFKEANKTRDRAYVCRTEHKIGAAVLCTDGVAYGGCNIESNISGLGCCAERVAVMRAITTGHYTFETLLLLDKELIIPCGACLQYLCEFMAIGGRDIQIISATLEGKIKKYSLKKLLPKAYFSKNKTKIEDYKNKT